MSALTNWERMVGDSFRALDIVQSRLGRLMTDIDHMFDKDTFVQIELNPRVDITEDKDTLYYMMELPGVKQEDIKVSAENGILTVRGEKRREEKKKDHSYRRVERGYGEFLRTFNLPDGVDAAKIQAELDNGVLEIRIPLPAEKKSTVNEIKVGSSAGRLVTAKTNGHQPVVA